MKIKMIRKRVILRRRGTMPPPTRVFTDRKKEQNKKMCRKSVENKENFLKS